MMNADIREEIRRRGLYAWDVARQLGVHKSTVFYWLGQDLTDEKRKRLINAINAASEKRKQEMLQ